MHRVYRMYRVYGIQHERQLSRERSWYADLQQDCTLRRRAKVAKDIQTSVVVQAVPDR